MARGGSKTTGRDRRRDDGFSLVEVMVAVVVAAVTIPIFVGLQLNAVKLTNRAGELDQAIWGAQAKMEELWLAEVKDVLNGEDTMTLADGRVLTREWTVQSNKPVVGVKTVTVTVSDSWIEESEPAELTFVISDRLKSFSSMPLSDDEDDDEDDEEECEYDTGSGKSKEKSGSGKSKEKSGSGKSKDSKSGSGKSKEEKCKSGKSKEKSGSGKSKEKSGSGKSGSGS